jgi:very-short-patch-repair endonuclease
VGCPIPPYGGCDNPHSADHAVQALAGRQHGVVTWEQLIAAGLSPRAIERRLEAGWLVRLYKGVYAVGHTALTRRSHLVAAVYACGPSALASHRAAGWLWGILRGAQPIEVTAPRSRTARDGFAVHRSRLIHDEDRAIVDGIPVTSIARTIVDIADVLSENRLADAVHESEVRRLFDLETVERVLDRLPGRKGRHKLGRVLAAYGDVQPFTRSRAERLVHKLCEDHGLPTPRVNTWIASEEADFFWPEAGVVLEFDGAETHLTRRAFHEDRARDRALAARGIQVIRATWRDATRDEASLARQIAVIVSRRTPA